MTLAYESAASLLAKHGQGHMLKFWDRLTADQKDGLLKQIAAIDFAVLAKMKAETAKSAAPASEIEPAPVLSPDAEERVRAKGLGGEALRAGKVGVLLVAGGQGTRLGFEGPKGVFPVGPITGATLFEIHARKILALERRYQSRVPFYIMTSESNHEDTAGFFRQHDCFGLDPERVKFFMQGQFPALWPDGRIVLERPDRIFMGPDGHGGVLAALEKSGMLADMQGRGVETVFYFQVDNPLVEIADPAFIGLHREMNADMSLKVCAKRGPDEGLGVVVRRTGRLAVVEYTELTAEQKTATLADGQLRFKFGSVAIHMFSTDFLRRETAAGLPLHRAHKKVPWCDEEGRPVKPDKPNAFKFEKFIFDALPDARRALILEFQREDEFSPIKNASGFDSPDTARRDLMLKHARWLESLGVKVPRNRNGDLLHRIEIDPAFASDPESLRARLPAGFVAEGDILLRKEKMLSRKGPQG